MYQSDLMTTVGLSVAGWIFLGIFLSFANSVCEKQQANPGATRPAMTEMPKNIV